MSHTDDDLDEDQKDLHGQDLNTDDESDEEDKDDNLQSEDDEDDENSEVAKLKAELAEKDEKIQKLKANKQKHIQKQKERKGGDDEELEEKIERIQRESREIRSLKSKDPTLDEKEVKTFARSKWLTITQAYYAMNAGSKKLASFGWSAQRWESTNKPQFSNPYASKDDKK